MISMAEKGWLTGLPGHSGGVAPAGESLGELELLETRRCSLSIMVPEPEGVFCSLLAVDELPEIESSEEELIERKAFVRPRLLLLSKGSRSSGGGSLTCGPEEVVFRAGRFRRFHLSAFIVNEV